MQILKYSHTFGNISLFSMTLHNNSCSIATQENNLIRKLSLFGKYKRSQNRWTIRTYGHSRLSFPSLVTQETNLLQNFPRISKIFKIWHTPRRLSTHYNTRKAISLATDPFAKYVILSQYLDLECKFKIIPHLLNYFFIFHNPTPVAALQHRKICFPQSLIGKQHQTKFFLNEKSQRNQAVKSFIHNQHKIRNSNRGSTRNE